MFILLSTSQIMLRVMITLIIIVSHKQMYYMRTVYATTFSYT